MPHCLSPANCLPRIGRFRRHPRRSSCECHNDERACTRSHRSQIQRVPSTTFHDLDDDSLLHIFYLFRPSLLEIDDSGAISWNLVRQRWWHKLVQVCQRWRCLILGSACHLRLRLVCIPGTPVAAMLAHSPPVPLIIGYDHPNHILSAEDEEGIMLALRHRDRVQCIYLRLPIASLQRLITAIDDEFPALEYLSIGPPTKHHNRLTLPPTFEAPHLRRLLLSHFASPIGSPLLSTTFGLVRLSLEWIHPSTCHPNDYLLQFSLLPQLETIDISFRSTAPNHDIEGQLLHAPVTIRITHSNLRSFSFVGVSAFLEALLSHMTAPLLKMFRVQFFEQHHFSVPHLSQFLMTTEKLRFSHVTFIFNHRAVSIFGYPGVDLKLSNFILTVLGRHFDKQVSSAAQISNFLTWIFSEVVDLTLDYREHTLSSELHNHFDYTQWHDLLALFRNVKTLRVHNGFIEGVSRSLQLNGEVSLDVLPELKELICPVGTLIDKMFTTFIHEREAAGQPVNLIREAFPVGRTRYWLDFPTGKVYIKPDPSLRYATCRAWSNHTHA